MIFKSICLLAVIVLAVNGSLYTGDSDGVVELTASNFNEKVLNSDELWFVEFYAPWCGHCKSLAPEWSKAARALKGIVNIGAVNMDGPDKSVGAPYGIQGFPTIKIFGANKQSPRDYSGGRTAQAITDEAINQLKTLVSQRLGGGSSSGKQSGSGSGSSSGSGSADPKDVVELTDSNFESTVLQSDDIWLVEFFAPWCGHCKNLAPEWAKAATELKGKVRLGALDATVHPSTAQRYGVNGYPTIKYFGPGNKDQADNYDGGRTSSDIVTWAMNKVAENAPAPEIVELLEQSQFEDACNNKQLCILGFMPSLYECQSECRTKYLDVMKRLGEKFKRNHWSWLWTESGKQSDVEAGLQIGGFGYPALVAINSRKGKFVTLRGSFSETGINEFLRELAVGRGSSESLPSGKLPTVKTAEPWDGKDAKLEVEEEIDLSDVSLDDDDGSVPIRKKEL